MRMHGRFLDREPQRGDVVVFKFPQDNSTDFIKRLIGLPGDRIQMINDVLYLNGKPVPRERVADYVGRSGRRRPATVTQYRETLPGGKSYLILDKDTDGAAGQYRAVCRAAGPLFHDGRQSRQFRRQPRRGGLCAGRKSGRQGGVPLLLDRRQRADSGKSGNGPSPIRYSRMFTLID